MAENGAIKDRIKSLRRVRVSELQAHPKNFRKHGQSQRRAMSAALQEIGFADALLVRETDSGLQIIDGHLRADLAKDQKVPVLVLDVNEHEAEKLLATFDAITGLAEIDEDLLRSLTDGLEFEAPELDELVAGLLGDEPGGVTEDDPPAAQDGPCVAQVGDVWACGRHRVVCGDSLDIANLDRLIAGAELACVLTDPPYGMRLDTDYSSLKGAKGSLLHGKVKGRVYRPVTGDDAPFDASHLYQYFASVREQFWFGADYYRRTIPEGDANGSWLVWDKRTEDTDTVIGAGFELVWSKQKHKRDLLRFYWCGALGDKDARKRMHPTQKPIRLLSEILQRWTSIGCIVVDPFLGSGTTLIAAEQLGRTCHGIEIEPRYVDVILQRYMNFTNVSPRRKSDGALFSELVKGESVHA